LNGTQDEHSWILEFDMNELLLSVSQISDSSKMRVLIVSEPGDYGVFYFVEELIHYLLKQSVEVDFAYSSVRSGSALENLVTFVKRHGGETLDLRVTNAPQPRDIGAFIRLRDFVRRRQPNVIHSHSSKAGVLVRMLRMTGIQMPLFYSPHAYYGMGGKPSLIKLLARVTETALSSIGKTILIGHSEARYADDVLGIKPDDRSVIHLGIDCQQFSPASQETRSRIRREFGVPEEALLLGTTARYSAQKDPLTVHRAVRSLLQRLSSLWFVHIGQGELWQQVDALGGCERIIRLRSIGSMEDFYKALDGFLLGSRYEGMPRVVIEAMATNLPLILTRAPGNLDFAGLGLSHLYWAEVADEADIASAVQCWASASSVGINHRDIALRLFQAEGCYHHIYKEYLATSAALTNNFAIVT
jgi:glycosyltransferase involved in cell wall biosynthesis